MARLRYNGMATGSAGSLADISLSGAHTSSTTTLTFNAALTYANGTAVPTISGGNYFMLSILDAGGRVAEVVKVTAYTSGTTSATVVRGQEGTTGVALASGAKVVHPETVGGLTSGFTSIRRTSGDITINATGWQALDTGLDLTLAGVQAGDVIEFIPSFMANGSAGPNFSFDVATVVSGSIVNYFGGSGSTSENGIAGWFAPGGVYLGVTGSAFYTVQAADIAAGAVTLRLLIRSSSTTARTVLATSANPLVVAARKVQ